MKIKVNDKEFDIEIFGNDNLEKKIEIKDDKLIIDNKEFYLDYYEEKEEELLLIINGTAFVVSKKNYRRTDNKRNKITYERSC